LAATAFRGVRAAVAVFTESFFAGVAFFAGAAFVAVALLALVVAILVAEDFTGAALAAATLVGAGVFAAFVGLEAGDFAGAVFVATARVGTAALDVEAVAGTVLATLDGAAFVVATLAGAALVALTGGVVGAAAALAAGTRTGRLAAGAALAVFGSERGLATTPLNDVPALNFGTAVFLIRTLSPVRGFLPTRAARMAFSNVPNPARVTFSPLATAWVMALMTASTAATASLRVGSAASIASTSSDLFMISSGRLWMRAIIVR
jgi:hypothetical protein